MRRICVYCGSSSGRGEQYAAAAWQLATCLVERGLELVYGGASVGIMGTLADAVLEAGGRVVGIIPDDLKQKEIAHAGVTDLRIVGSMHERKALMAELSDGFIAMPGGLGTLEEIFEIVTWAVLGLHAKPCGLLNVGGYYDRLAEFLDHAEGEGFIKSKYRPLLMTEADPAALLDRFERWRGPKTPQWITPATS